MRTGSKGREIDFLGLLPVEMALPALAQAV
jgi:hypothetical protein